MSKLVLGDFDAFILVNLFSMIIYVFSTNY